MAHLVLLQTASLRQYMQIACDVFSLPQWKYFVTVLLGMLKCDETRTLSGILRQVAVQRTVSGLSRFLQQAPWSIEALTNQRQKHFNALVAPEVVQAHADQRAQQPRKRGRRRQTVVTGYLALDDSTCVQAYACKMEGQGWHYSSSDKRSMPGHSLFQSVYCLLGRQLPLTPQMYRQKTVCEKEGVPFRSKIDMAVQEVETFVPPADTHTHVLADSWYVAKQVWRAVRQRGWDFTGGLKSNRQLRITLADGQRLWQRVDHYAAGLTPDDFQPVLWPSIEGGRWVYGYLVRTRIKKLGACQVLIVKPEPDAPPGAARYWVTSRLTDSLAQVVAAVAMRWVIEVLFADFKELLGADHYQVRSAQAIVRFWAIGLFLYQYLDEQRVSLQRQRGVHVTLGETRTWVRQQHTDLLLNWIVHQAAQGVSAAHIQDCLRPALL
ncbi:MAG: transposase [Caldilineae bacterium]|nr:transposase [Caldilineae bacterium]